ncbi:phage tailspike protein [Escherichia coli]
MTVSTVIDHNDYAGNGVTTVFPYTFRVFVKSDLAVTVVDPDGNITQLVLDTDYTVTGAGGYSGGSVVLKSPLSNGWQISVARDLDPVQETDLRNQGKFFAETHEDVFDRLTMLIQQAFSAFRLSLRKPSSIANWYDALGNYIRNVRDPRDPQDAATKNYVDSLAGSNQMRTLRVPEPINSLPGVELRKNKMPAFDDGGNPIVVVPPSGSASDVMIDLAKPTGAGAIGYQYKNNASSTKRTVRDKLDERVSLWDFHCDSNGNVILPGPTIDSRQYIQNAIDYLNAKGGGTLTIPTGTWWLNSYGKPDKIAGYSGIIQLLSNVDIFFEAGSRVKLTSYFNEKPYCVFCGFNGNDPATSASLNKCNIYGTGVIDCGDSNRQPVGGALCYAIGTGRSYDCNIRDIYITGGDLTWAATLGWNGYGSNTVVDNVTVTHCKKSDIERNVDQSLFYVGCPYSGVKNCYMNPSPDTQLAAKISAAVELHQLDTFCTNNYMFGFMRGVYVVLHSGETGGQGTFMSRIHVTGNTAFINGQFVTIGAEAITANTHIYDVIVANNICVVMNPVDSAPLIRCFIASDVWTTAPPDSDTARVLVTDNTFFSPTTVSDSMFFFFRISTRGYYFSGNMCDCRRIISGDGAGTGTVELRDIVWDSTNVLGTTWLGQRGGTANMIELYVAAVLRCRFDVAMTYSDGTIANIVYAPDATSIDYSVIKVAPENIPSGVMAVGVSQANKAKSTNYFSYPVTLPFGCFAQAGAVFCYTTGTDFGWCASAEVLSKPGVVGLTTPGSYGVKDNGQLGGVGYNDTATARTWNQRVLLKSSTQ